MSGTRADQILKKLCNAGYEAYYVGGCVRDFLLGRAIHDWDITTSAHPEQVLSLFGHCILTGIRHGTVTVLEDGIQAEVTTFRADGAYLDGRHPSAVRFVPCLAEDLARRDFTVNAMAMDLDGTITDLYGGQQDLMQKQIRCVGIPETRFHEDALRILRAYRFCAQLGFTLEPQTQRAAEECSGLTASLSVERVRDEMEKTLLSPHPQALCHMARIGLLDTVGITELPALDWLNTFPSNATLRWAALKVLYPSFDPIDLRLPKKICNLLCAITEAYRPSFDRLTLKRCIAHYGWEVASVAAELSGSLPLLQQIRKDGECVTLHQLALTGRDFPTLRGKEIGQTLNRLLEHVLSHPEDNCRETLLLLAKSDSDLS